MGIEKRPEIVEEKSRLADWELDTIIGSGKKEAIVSMVERTSKMTKLKKVSKQTGGEVREGLIEKLGPMKDFVLTLTADNGKEFSGHREISNSLDTNFYFARPHHAWERGLNEHTNGLTKGNSSYEVTDEEIEQIEFLLNNRARKVLNFSTSLEVFSRLIKKPLFVALQK